MKKKQTRPCFVHRNCTIQGNGDHHVKITPEMLAALDRQKEAFKKKFGREPGPDEPVFFDPDADTPQPLTEGKITAMLRRVYFSIQRRK